VITKPLDELYLTWLYRQVANPENLDPAFTFWKLLKHLYTTEFVWLIPNDDNRLEDGKELRVEFIQDEGLDDLNPDVFLGCSVLELMVGLSRRLSFEAEGEPHYWFWLMMENLGLHRYSDDWKRFPRIHIDKILDRVIFRTYKPNGDGGFFPLKHPEQDQRKVELWYQLSAYVLEQS
jgi:hypothetical protein